MLIHRRSRAKKTWPGFWTNACCSHPRKGESLDSAIQRRMVEELGFSCPVSHLFAFHYEALYDERYGENEVDHVFVGTYDGPVYPDHSEIEEWTFVPFDALGADMAAEPKKYTPWFKEALPGVLLRLRGEEAGEA